MTSERGLVAAPGVYFAATGRWPLLHMRSFEAVTGPIAGSSRPWVSASPASAPRCSRRPAPIASHRRFAGSRPQSALALTGIDIYYSARRRIGPVDLLDAVVEAGIAGLLSRR
jgi:hypothetical protein